MSSDLHPPPLAQALIAIRDAAEQLDLLLRPELQENSAAKCAFDELVRSVSLSLSLAEEIGSTSGGGERKSVSASYHKRRISRRRSQSYSCRKILKTLEDGHSWRKYGQKEIQSAKYPRSYFRCTHKTDQGCKAIRQVQVSEEDPSSFVLTYLGEHTCQDPLLVPQIISTPGAAKVSQQSTSFGISCSENIHTCQDPLLAPQIISTAGAAKGSQQSTSFGISCSDNIRISEAVVPQPSPVPSLIHEHCEEEVASHLRFPFGNDGYATSTASMAMDYFMEDFADFESSLDFHDS